MGSSDWGLNIFEFDDTPGSLPDLNIVAIDHLFCLLNRVLIGVAIDNFARTLNASILVEAVYSVIGQGALLHCAGGSATTLSRRRLGQLSRCR